MRDPCPESSAESEIHGLSWFRVRHEVVLEAVNLERDLSVVSQPFDVAIIGGGITGIQVAREAAGRGLRTVLIDKGDFGAGTSSATSKLIHGGIRYLEQAQFGVVRESLRERRILSLGAPHLVEQRRFIMPGWRWSRPSTALLGAGVGLYSLLGFDSNRSAPPSLRIPMPRWMSARSVRAAIPWLYDDGLQGAWVYHDTMNVFPERLLLAYAASAAADGAVLLNHVEATGFAMQGDTVHGVEVVDRLDGQRHRISATAVVNAAGPWADLVVSSLQAELGLSMVRSKGVHLLTTPVGGAASTTDTVFARGRSGRHVIVSPWQGHSFIGPTDTEVAEEPDDLRVQSSDVELLLDTVNETLGSGIAPMVLDDVVDTTLGVRPLMVDEGKSSYTASRRHEIYDHAKAGVKNLWSIGGGKWTTGRATAVQMLDLLVASPALSAATPRRFDSRRAAVFGAFAWAQDAAPFFAEVVSARPEIPLSAETRVHLARLYGTDSARIMDLVATDPSLAEPISHRSGRLDIAAQAVVAVTDEGARTLSDVLDRRLVIGTLGPVELGEIERVGALIGPLLGWDTDRIGVEVDSEHRRRSERRCTWGALSR